MGNANPVVSNPNDFKVVSFHNSTTFGFTPEMGCMYDGRGINGKNGSPGIDAGETIVLPYHIGHRLAVNLAKRVLNTTQAATVDAQGVPTGVPIWNPEKLENLKNTFLTELYSEDKPLAQSETDKLMAKVEEYKKMVDKLIPLVESKSEIPATTPVVIGSSADIKSNIYQDKQEVITELTKRGIKFDARSNKSNLEKLLV